MDSTKMNRRSFLKVAAVGAASATLAACGATPTATPMPKPTTAPAAAATKAPAAGHRWRQRQARDLLLVDLRW